MLSDRELLELAAKAVGITCEYTEPSLITNTRHQMFFEDDQQYLWNPLTDDGDALRLAVKLGLVIDTKGDKTFCGTTQYDSIEHHGTDPYAATRRAITRAAAEIGRAIC